MKITMSVVFIIQIIAAWMLSQNILGLIKSRNEDQSAEVSRQFCRKFENDEPDDLSYLSMLSTGTIFTSIIYVVLITVQTLVISQQNSIPLRISIVLGAISLIAEFMQMIKRLAKIKIYKRSPLPTMYANVFQINQLESTPFITMCTTIQAVFFLYVIVGLGL